MRMQLLDIDVESLKKLKGRKKEETLLKYEEKKEKLIKEYIQLQDILDEYNEKINTICCSIEQINIALEEISGVIPTKGARTKPKARVIS